MAAMALCSLVSAVALPACDGFITEDLDPCAPPPKTITTVDFVYDYNMERVDLLPEHVGSIYLYVFDEAGIYRYRRTAHKALMTDGIDFSMRFDESEIRPGHTYQFVAVAQGNHLGYDASLETPGFTLQTDMIPGLSTIEDYVLKLDRDDDGTFDFGVVNFKDAYGNNTEMIDTVWTTKPDEVQIARIPALEYVPDVTPEPDRFVEVTIPLMRITNAITVNLKSSYFNNATSVDSYNILINFPHGNGTIDFTGRTFPAQELYYRTLRKTLVNYNAQNLPRRRPARVGENDLYGIRAEFGVSRLQIGDESSLQVRDAQTNDLIFEIPNFSDYLADAFDGDQEFLDREYDFQVDVQLTPDGSDWLWFQAYIEVLGWSVRINNIKF